MSAIRIVLREAAHAITVAALVEFGLVAVFLAGVAVAFALAVTP
jgi:hypothetical protein